MVRPFLLVLVPVALGLGACAAPGDPPTGGPVREPESAAKPALEARDVAILVVEQGPSYLRVASANRRPRSAFGPAASWNGSGAPTHSWKLLGQHHETIASGPISARTTLEAPPSAGAPAANVPMETATFTVKVPQPEVGETIEIAPVNGGPTARWP